MAKFIVTLAASAVIAASAVVVDYVALAPSLLSWWQLRSFFQQSRQAAQVHVEESIFRVVCAAPASVAESRCCEQQKRCGVPFYCAASSKDVGHRSFLIAVTAAVWFRAGSFCRALRSLEFTLELQE